MNRCILSIVAFFLITAPAAAFPGERPLDVLAWQEVRLAKAYWAARGVTGCEYGITAQFASNLAVRANDDPDFILGQAMQGGCRIWLSDRLAHLARERGALWQRIADECQVVVHEVGHALGLDHGYGGVMTERDLPVSSYPSECLKWAHWNVRVRRAARRWTGSRRPSAYIMYRYSSDLVGSRTAR